MATNDPATEDALVGELKATFGESIVEVDQSFDDLVVVVVTAASHDVLGHLKTKHGFDLLMDIAGVDCMELEGARERFELEYVLYATESNARIRVRILVPESNLEVATVSDLWRSANWAEREAYEFFGFKFVGHPNLRRLLTHHEFVGHPLRKDYPVMKGQWCSTTRELDAELNE